MWYNPIEHLSMVRWAWGQHQGRGGAQSVEQQEPTRTLRSWVYHARQACLQVRLALAQTTP